VIKVAMDNFTKWVEAAALPDSTAKTQAEFLVRQIIAMHGRPRVILTDNGGDFLNDLNSYILSSLGIQETHTTPYHPAANGMVERINATLKDCLSKYMEGGDHTLWECYLALCVMCYNTSVNKTTGYTPFFLHHGREARGIVDDMLPIAPAKLSKNQREYAEELKILVDQCRSRCAENIHHSQSLYNKPEVVHHTLRTLTSPLPRYAIGDLVLKMTPVLDPPAGSKLSSARIHKLTKMWRGPFIISKVLNNTTYALRRRSSTDTLDSELIHCSRIKPYHGPAILTTLESSKAIQRDFADQSDDVSMIPLDPAHNPPEPESSFVVPDIPLPTLSAEVLAAFVRARHGFTAHARP